MRVPLKRSKSYKSDVQTEIEQSSKALFSPTQPKDQLNNSRRRRLSKRPHSSASIPTTAQFLDTPVADTKPDEPSSRRQLVNRVAVQWRKTTQKKMGLNKKTPPQSKRNFQYEAVLYVSDSEGELDMTQSTQETVQNEDGGETTRPRDSAVPSEINLKPDDDIYDQLDPVMVTGEVSNDAPSTAKEADVNITTIITDNERSKHNDDDEIVHPTDSAPPLAADAPIGNDEVRDQEALMDVSEDVNSQDELPAPTASTHQSHSEISDDDSTRDADFMPPSRTPSPLMFCKRSLRRSRNISFAHQESFLSASSVQDNEAQQRMAEADTPCPTRVSMLPFVTSGEETAHVDEANTEDEGDDRDATSEAVAQPEVIHNEEEADVEIAQVIPLPEDDLTETATTSETGPEAAEADEIDDKSVIISPGIDREDTDTASEVESDGTPHRSVNVSPEIDKIELEHDTNAEEHGDEDYLQLDTITSTEVDRTMAEMDTHSAEHEDEAPFSPDTDTLPGIVRIEVEMNTRDTNENHDDQHGPEENKSITVANTEVDASVQTANDDDNNDTHDEQDSIQIQVFGTGIEDGDDDGHEILPTVKPEHNIEADAHPGPGMHTEEHEIQHYPQETTIQSEPTDTKAEEADTTETNTTTKHRSTLSCSSAPLDIPNSPNPRSTTLQDTISCMNDLYPPSTGNSPVSTFSASESFPPNSFPPLSVSFPEDLPRGTPLVEDIPTEGMPKERLHGEPGVGVEVGPIVFESVVPSTLGKNACERSYRSYSHFDEGILRRRLAHKEPNEDDEGEDSRISDLAADTSNTMHNHDGDDYDDHKKEKRQSWKQWLMGWLIGCAGKRK